MVRLAARISSVERNIVRRVPVTGRIFVGVAALGLASQACGSPKATQLVPAVEIEVVNPEKNNINPLMNIAGKEIHQSELDQLVKLVYKNKLGLKRILENSEIKDGSVRSLTLDGPNVRDISALANLTYLRVLNLSFTNVRDIGALANLTYLRVVNLNFTGVGDVSALANLINLQVLLLAGTRVSDISALANLKNLQELDLRRTNISDKQIADLKGALSGLVIY